MKKLILFLVLISLNVNSQTNHQDYPALKALYDATDGANWNNKWDLSQPISDWYGIELNTDNRVVSIKLINNNLKGEIPKKIGELTEVKFFDLHNWSRSDQLSGAIPNELFNLEKLEYLDLSKNALSGIISPNIKNLINLKELYLYLNNLEGNIPKEIFSLLKIKILGLSFNSLEGNIPSEIGNLKELEVLYLNDNFLSGEIPQTIWDLLNLKIISLKFNNLTGKLHSGIGNLVKLESLNIEYNSLSGNIPAEIGNLSNLVELHLNNNRLEGELPDEIGNLFNLVTLYLGNNRLEGELPDEIGNLSNLKKLSLGSNLFSGNIPNSIINLHNIQYIGLMSNFFSGKIPNLSLLNTLIAFQISWNNFYFDSFDGHFSYYKENFHEFWYEYQLTQDDKAEYEVLVGNDFTLEVNKNKAAPKFTEGDKFQWSQGGVIIPGANSSTYTITDHVYRRSYSCRITNEKIPDMIIFSPYFTVNYVNSLSVEVENEILKNSISIYPNPAAEFITIKENDNLLLKELSVYNILGKKVKSSQNNFNKINISHLENGVYFIKIKTDKGEASKKLIVNKS